MASAPRTPTRKAQSFINANQASPLVYQSYDEASGITTFRLADGKRIELSAGDTASIREYRPRWLHLMEAANDSQYSY